MRKKVLSFFIIALLSLLFMIGCDKEMPSRESESESQKEAMSESLSESKIQSESQTESEDVTKSEDVTESQTQSEDETELQSDSKAPDVNDSLAPDKPIQLPMSFTEIPSKEYYTVINTSFHGYDTSNLIDYDTYGDYYMLIKDYESFTSIFTNGHFLDKRAFDEGYMLVIYRHYGGKYSTDLGFSNFRIENGVAKIDHASYTGDGFMYNDAEFYDLSVIIIPKSDEYNEVTALTPIELNEALYHSVSYFTHEYELVEMLDEIARIVLKTDKFSPWIWREYGLYLGIALPYPVLVANTRIEGDVLILELEVGSNYSPSDGILWIDLGETEIQSEDDITGISVITRKHDCDSYVTKLTEDEWKSALDATEDAENVTESIYATFRNPTPNSTYKNYLCSLNSTRRYTDSLWHRIDSEHWCIGDTTYIGHIKNEFLWDFESNTSYYTENDAWVKADGLLMPKDQVSSMNFYALKGAFKYARLQSDGTYTIASYEGYENINIRIANGVVVYIEYSIGERDSNGRYDEYYRITYSDYGTTQVEPIDFGDEF